MRITKVHIDEYKIFKNFDIDFTHEGKSQNLIVLAGINGTGKTTLLEFLQKGFTSGNFVSENSFLEFRGVYEEFTINETATTKVDLSKTDYTHSRNAILYNAGEKDTSGVENSIVAYIDYCIYNLGVAPFDAYEKLHSFIGNIFAGFNLSFEFQQLTAFKKPLFKTGTATNLNFDDLSTGERQILTNILQLYIWGGMNTIILVDEPEFSLHPSWQNLVTKVYQRYADEYKCQIILATHSPQIIGSVKPEQIRVLQNDNGVIKVANPVEHSYGLPVDKVLRDVMGIKHLRTPDIDKKIEQLADMISDNQYESEAFLSGMKGLEDTLGYTDTSLVLMRFEIAKRKRQKQ